MNLLMTLSWIVASLELMMMVKIQGWGDSCVCGSIEVMREGAHGWMRRNKWGKRVEMRKSNLKSGIEKKYIFFNNSYCLLLKKPSNLCAGYLLLLQDL